MNKNTPPLLLHIFKYREGVGGGIGTELKLLSTHSLDLEVICIHVVQRIELIPLG